MCIAKFLEWTRFSGLLYMVSYRTAKWAIKPSLGCVKQYTYTPVAVWRNYILATRSDMKITKQAHKNILDNNNKGQMFLKLIWNTRIGRKKFLQNWREIYTLGGKFWLDSWQMMHILHPWLQVCQHSPHDKIHPRPLTLFWSKNKTKHNKQIDKKDSGPCKSNTIDNIFIIHNQDWLNLQISLIFVYPVNYCYKNSMLGSRNWTVLCYQWN